MVNRAARRPATAPRSEPAITSQQIARGFLLFCALVFAWSLGYPALNWPDEIFVIVQSLPNTANPYLSFLRYVGPDSCDISWVTRPDAQFGGNRFFHELTGGSGCYRHLKIFNALAISALAGAFLWACRTREQRWLYILAIIWPAQLFFLTGINSQVVFALGSIFVAVKVSSTTTSVLPYIFLSLPLLLVDRSTLTLIIFLTMLLVLKQKPRAAVLIFAALIVVGRLEVIPISDIAALFGEDLLATQASTARFDDGLIASLALFVISFVYLGGTSAVFGIGLDYLAVCVFIAAQYTRKSERSTLNLHLMAFVLTYLLVLEYVPSIQTFRYYVFMGPILIQELLPSRRFQRRYVVYCAVLSVIYLGHAEIIAGLS